MDKARKTGAGKAIGLSVMVIACGALAFGGYTVFHGAGQSAAPAAYVAPVAQSVAAPTQDMTTATYIYDQQVVQAKADAQAVIDAQAAADAAAQAAASTSTKIATKSTATVSGPIVCPAGSTVQGYDDNNNATACIPDACLGGIGGPGQPTNEQCVVFKP